MLKVDILDLWLSVGALHLLFLLALMRHTAIILLIHLLFSWLFCSVGTCTVFVIFTLLLCWYLYCSNRAPEFLPVWNNLQSVAKTDLFVYSLFYFLLLVSFLACFHSGLPPSLGSFWFSTFSFVCFQVYSSPDFLPVLHNCEAFAKTGFFIYFSSYFFICFLACFHPRLPPCLA